MVNRKGVNNSLSVEKINEEGILYDKLDSHLSKSNSADNSDDNFSSKDSANKGVIDILNDKKMSKKLSEDVRGEYIV